MPATGEVKQGFYLAIGFFLFAVVLGFLFMILGKVSK